MRGKIELARRSPLSPPHKATTKERKVRKRKGPGRVRNLGGDHEHQEITASAIFSNQHCIGRRRSFQSRDRRDARFSETLGQLLLIARRPALRRRFGSRGLTVRSAATLLVNKTAPAAASLNQNSHLQILKPMPTISSMAEQFLLDATLCTALFCTPQLNTPVAQVAV